jgi:hypothetical protein
VSAQIEADEANAAKARAAHIEWKRRQVAAKRTNEPLPIGSLFDEVTRSQKPLF